MDKSNVYNKENIHVTTMKRLLEYVYKLKSYERQEYLEGESVMI